MKSHDDAAVDPSAREGLVDRVLHAIREHRGSLTELSPRDLASVDGFHIRGHLATAELAELAEISPELRVLDIGSGPGGAARYLAAGRGAQVTGLDFTPSFVRLADTLSNLVGLGGLTSFECGSALALPFADGSFDCVWMEHVQMNIRDKAALVTEARRVLVPRGKLAMHEVFASGEGEPYLPAPWAEDAATSFLIEPEHMRDVLEREGFMQISWQDVTNASRSWFAQARQCAPQAGPPALGIHLLMGENTEEKMRNVERSLEMGRLAVIQAVFQKTG